MSNDWTWNDGVSVKLGTVPGFRMYHQAAGDTYFELVSDDPLRIVDSVDNTIARFTGAEAELYYNGVRKLHTTNAGVTVTGTVTADNFIDSSDERLKKDIKKLNPINVELVSYIEPVEYKLKADAEGRVQYGVIAQQFKKLFPDLVYENNDGYLSVDYRSIAILQLAKLQQLEARVDKLEGKNGRT